MTDYKIELILGAVLIFIYATERFNTPRTIRSSTTAAQYFTALGIYIFTYQVTFLVFSKYPALLQTLLAQNPADLNPADSGAGDEGAAMLTSDSMPIFVAMIFSMMVPKIPLVSELDARLRAFLHRLASIPFEAIRLSKELQSLSFVIPDSLRSDLFKEIETRQFPVDLDKLEHAHPIARTWVDIAALVLQLRNWEQENAFAAFAQERTAQLERIRERYNLLTSMAISAHSLAQQAAAEPGVEVLQAATRRMCENLRSEEKNLFAEICDFISQAVLNSCYREHSRRATLQRLGFQAQEKIYYDGLTIHQMVSLAGLLMLMLFTSFILMSQSTLSIERTLLLVTLIVAVYAVSTLCAVYPKARWQWFQHQSGEFYPFASYLAAALLAVATSGLMNLFFNCLILVSSPEVHGITTGFNLAWTKFSTISYPWLSMAFVTTFALAFLIDLELPAALPQRAQRLLKGVFMMLVLMGAVAVVYSWVNPYYNNIPEGRKVQLDLNVLLFRSAMIGLVLGYFVPAWFRASNAFGSTGNALETAPPVAVSADAAAAAVTPVAIDAGAVQKPATTAAQGYPAPLLS